MQLRQLDILLVTSLHEQSCLLSFAIKMKLIVAALIMILGICNAEFIHHNGQPGCKTDQELSVKNYRNNWDPTAFWLCEVKGQAATRVKCPDGTAWLESSKDCVEWSEWVWERPANPPSRP